MFEDLKKQSFGYAGKQNYTTPIIKYLKKEEVLKEEEEE